jgi:hypothetical protein
MNDNAKKLLQCFLDIEDSQYPEVFKDRLIERNNKVIDLIEKYGVNHVTVSTYTNMMQFLSSVTIDTFKGDAVVHYDLDIELGSEVQELSAHRNLTVYSEESKRFKVVPQYFNFKTNEWCNQIGK